MKIRNLLMALLLGMGAQTCVASTPPVLEIRMQVQRMSEFALTTDQVQHLDEATKVSGAIRTFHSLYGRWPKDAAELRERTTGIDYSVLGDSLRLEPDGKDLVLVYHYMDEDQRMPVRAGEAASESTRQQAQLPGFKIRMTLEKVASAGDPAMDPAQVRQIAEAAEPAIAEVLKKYPDAREAHFLLGRDEAGQVLFGVDIIFDGSPNEDAIEAVRAAFSRLAPSGIELQVVQLPPADLKSAVGDSPPFYRRAAN